MIIPIDYSFPLLKILGDVKLTAPSNGQVLIYDGTQKKWINGPGSGTAHLSDVGDVNVTGISDGDILMWDSMASTWLVSDCCTYAIKLNLPSQFSTVLEKTTPVGADLIIIEDSADFYNKKYVQITNLPGGGGGLAHITETYSVAFATDQLLASGTATDISIALQPKGNGALSSQLPTGTVAGGNARGAMAIDFQIWRSAADEVASGLYSFIGSGQNNKNASIDSAIVSGANNVTVGNQSAFIGAGSTNNIGALISVGNTAIVAGSANTAGGDNNIIGGGASNIINLNLTYCSILGGLSNILNQDADYSSIVGGHVNEILTTATNLAKYEFIGGGESNVINGSGGGTPPYSNYSVITGGSTNAITGAYCFVGGGFTNLITANNYAFIGGGKNNAISAMLTDGRSVIAGGDTNMLGGDYNIIGGGKSNSINANLTYCSILGGSGNIIPRYADYSSIVGGHANVILTSATNLADYAFIGGGGNNTITGSGAGSGPYSNYSAISGGYQNNITGPYGFVGGGNTNTITGPYGFVGGGTLNSITSNDYSSIVGGYNNVITSYVASGRSVIVGGQGNALGGDFNIIGGGETNSIDSNVLYCSILGGISNVIPNLAHYSSIVGGQANSIVTSATNFADYSFIGGGGNNVINGSGSGVSPFSNYSVIAGGHLNSITGPYNFIGGGSNNLIPVGNYSVITGGNTNSNSANQSFIGTGSTNTIAVGADNSVISGGANNTIGALGLYASIPGGSGASTDMRCAEAFGGGEIAGAGDAQRMETIMRLQTTDATANQSMLIDGVGHISSALTAFSWNIEINLVARNKTDGKTNLYKFITYLDVTASTPTLPVAPSFYLATEGFAGAVTLLTTYSAGSRYGIDLQVTGVTGKTINWVADVKIVQTF